MELEDEAAEKGCLDAASPEGNPEAAYMMLSAWSKCQSM